MTYSRYISIISLY